MKPIISAICALVLSFIIFPTTGVTEGTIKGTVRYIGEIQTPKKFVFQSFPNAQFFAKHPLTTDGGRRRIFNLMTVGQGGALQDAIVAIRDIQEEAWREPFSQTHVDITLCDFSPYTGIVVNRKMIQFVNHVADPDDPKSQSGVLHTVRAYEVLTPRSLVMFGIGLPTKGSELNKPIKVKIKKRGSTVRLTFDQHESMQSTLLPVQSPNFNPVNEKGEFEIVNVPSGEHTLLAWHSVAGQVEKTITVSDGETILVHFEIHKS